MENQTKDPLHQGGMETRKGQSSPAQKDDGEAYIVVEETAGGIPGYFSRIFRGYPNDNKPLGATEWDDAEVVAVSEN